MRRLPAPPQGLRRSRCTRSDELSMTDTTQLAEQLVLAVHIGDVDAVARIIADAPELVVAPLGGRFQSRTALHVVADWPGYFPNGPEIVNVLLAAGADPNARDPGPGSESPLHWAASS